MNFDIKFDIHQHLISEFADKMSQADIRIHLLMRENNRIKKALEDLSCKNQEMMAKMPTLLQRLAQQCMKNSNKHKNAYRYDEFIKNTALLFYLCGRRLMYNLFGPNLGLPSRKTIMKRLQTEPSLDEGVSQIKHIKKEILASGHEPFVWAGEDETKVISRPRYDSTKDIIVGLQLPTDVNEMPISNFFKFSSVQKVREYIEKYPRSSYIKLVACRTLHPEGKVFIVLIYGTNGSDLAENVMKRMEYLRMSFMEVGITMMGWSSDGATPFLKHMQIVSGIPIPDSDCPEEIKWFYNGKWAMNYLNMQDGKHLAVKLYRRLINTQLVIGTGTASSSILYNLLDDHDRGSMGITSRDIRENRDQMDFNIVRRVCSDKIIDNLVNEDEFATKTFLQLIRHVILAYIDHTTTPEDRIYHSWWVCLFCRVWKNEFINFKTKRTKAKSKKGDFEPTMALNFLTSNAHASIEINAHCTLRFCMLCKDMKKPHLFLPSICDSQMCENLFRLLRAFTTVFHSQITTDVLEVLQKSKRLRVMEELLCSLNGVDGFFLPDNFGNSSRKNMFVPKVLPTLDECCGIVRSAWVDVKSILSALGIKCSDLPPKFNISEPGNSKNNEEVDEENTFQVQEPDVDFETYSELDDIWEETQAQDHNLLENFEELSNMMKSVSSNECFGVKEMSTENVPRDHIAFESGGKIKCIRKSTILWEILTSAMKIPSDRLSRFKVQEEKSSEDLREENITIGDWIVMSISKEEIVCKVIAFEYAKKRNYKFKNLFCPIHNPKGSGILVKVTSFTIADEKELKLKNQSELHNIIHYQRHAEVKRDRKLLKYILIN